ncbi:MAG: hypothetical protein ACTSRS_16335 [Candidatus Helarchaeota archaeon]
MYGNISDEETNELIRLVSDNVRRNLEGRSVIETPLFPVSHYIHTATYILYQQTFQYNVLKEVAQKLPPEELARRNKTFSAAFNQLAMNSFAMLYLHGRGQIIYENLEYNKKHPHNKIEVEPEEKKRETKFILDYWKRLSPNYRNDGKLTVEDGTIRILSKDFIETLLQEMTPVHDKPEIIRKVKRTTATLTSRNFLALAECRAGIFEQGPYETAVPDEVLIFKEFISLYTGESLLGFTELLGSEEMDPLMSHIKTKATSPVDNVVIGMTLKNMTKLEFNDWGTMFAEPSDFTDRITSIGIWTREMIAQRDMRYPDQLGTIKKLSIDVLDPLLNYAQDALNEMYIEIMGWDYLRKLLLGMTLYTCAVVGVSALYAGVENNFNWTWPIDILNDDQHYDMVNTRDVKDYIKKLEQYPMGVHPLINRVFRSKKKHRLDPFYYLLQD